MCDSAIRLFGMLSRSLATGHLPEHCAMLSLAATALDICPGCDESAIPLDLYFRIVYTCINAAAPPSHVPVRAKGAPLTFGSRVPACRDCTGLPRGCAALAHASRRPRASNRPKALVGHDPTKTLFRGVGVESCSGCSSSMHGGGP
jgi:hypothetical protein